MKTSFMYEGKRYYVYGKDEKELAVKKALKLHDLEQGVTVDSSMLFEDWAKEWLGSYKKGHCNEKTYQDYEHRFDAFILPLIGKMKLKDIYPVHIQKIMHGVSHMSQSRIDKIYQAVEQVFRTAEDNDLITKTPVRGISKPKGFAGTHRSITDHERKVLLKVASYHRHGLWIKIMLYCGLRPIETGEIRIMHFDFEKKILFIDGKKSKNAARYVPVPDDILDEVKATGKEPFDYLFVNLIGNPINRTNRERMWISIKRAMHIEMGGKIFRNAIVPPIMVAEDLVPYCLRHTFCTDLQDAGVPINVAKELMGHSDITLTAKIYTHYTETAFNNARNLIQKYRDEKGNLDSRDSHDNSEKESHVG